MKSPRAILPLTTELLQDGISRGWHTGVQLYVSRQAEPVADFGWGEASPGKPMTAELLLPWLSAGKPLTVVLIAQLWERGDLDLDDPVAKHLPEFAQGGKQAITLRHLLTHTSGLPVIETGWPQRSWPEIITDVCETPLPEDHRPGEQAAYQPAASWFLLGEIVSRIRQRPFLQVVRDDLCEPLALHDTWCGMPADIFTNYESAGRLAPLYERQRHESSEGLWHTEAYCTNPSPGAGCRGPVRELGRVYETLLAAGQGDEAAILARKTVKALTHRHRVGLYDETLRHTVDFGLGFLIDSNHYGAETVPYGYGRYCSPGTFGHGGAQSSIGFADPAHDLVVCWVANGRPGEPRHNKRNRQINKAIYRDLGLS